LFIGLFFGVSAACVDFVNGGACVEATLVFLEPVLSYFIDNVGGAVPYFLEAQVDEVTGNLFQHSYALANIVGDQDNFNSLVGFLQSEGGRASEFAHILPHLEPSRNFFMAGFPSVESIEDSLFAPEFLDIAPENWFVKLFYNVWPQIKLFFWVRSQVAPGANGLWLIVEFYHA